MHAIPAQRNAASRRRRAFILTLDGFVTLALLASVFSVLAAVQANPGEPGARFLEPLAYDYLVGAYRFELSPYITTTQFATITNLTISETEPGGTTNNVIGAQLKQPGALCGCTSWSTNLCTVTKTAVCLTTNETATLVTRTAYITPP